MADEIVVMNNGRIEQAGTAREVFNAPSTEFVAKFFGGHNVLSLPQGRFALRADEVRLAAEGTEAVVNAVDFQGAHVALTARASGDQEILVLTPEAIFFANPKSPGDAVRLAWDPSRLHRLSA